MREGCKNLFHLQSLSLPANYEDGGEGEQFLSWDFNMKFANMSLIGFSQTIHTLIEMKLRNIAYVCLSRNIFIYIYFM